MASIKQLVELAGLKRDEEIWIESQEFKGSLRGEIAIELWKVLDQIAAMDRLIESEKARLKDALERQDKARLQDRGQSFDHTWIVDHAEKLERAGEASRPLTDRAVILARFLKMAREGY